MRPEVESINMPDWLSTDQFLFNINNILKDSLYYPSSLFDGDPVRYLMGNIFSFIYVDYGVSRDVFQAQLNNQGFRGYKIIHKQSIELNDLIPNGWTVRIQPDRNERYPNVNHGRDWSIDPFCEWIIFEREEDLDDSHNPKRFSLLYLCADGSAAYQALYLSNNCKPKAIAIIYPGHGFGNNWTDFTDRNNVFARSVFHNQNLLPDYIINQGWNWNEYNDSVSRFSTGRIIFNIWKRT